MGTLTDAGPLVAIVDRAQAKHSLCVKALSDLVAPLITTWPCFAEAMYLLARISGWNGQEQLWRMVSGRHVHLYSLNTVETDRMRALMEQYSDVPMDLADASLVAVAESMGTRRVFTLDSDFYVYRAYGTQSFDVSP